MHVIAMANQKGGVGKTTTTIGVGAAAARAGLPTIIIDWDPQGHLSESLGFGDDELEAPATLAGLLLGQWEGDLRTLLRQVDNNLWVIPSNLDMFLLEPQMYTRSGREYLLSRLLDALAAAFSVCLIDCPPSLGALTDSALVAARQRDKGEATTGSVLVPVESEHSTIKALRLLFKQIDTLRNALRVAVTVAGLVINKYDGRRGKVVTTTRESLERNFTVLAVTEDRTTQREAWAEHNTVIAYDEKSTTAGWYRDLAYSQVGHLGGDWNWGPPVPAQKRSTVDGEVTA